MNREDAITLMTAWDTMDGAAQRVSVAQPATIGAAVADLDRARLAMRDIVHKIVMTTPMVGGAL